MEREILVEITGACQGSLNTANLIGAEFEAFMVLGYQNMSPGILFQVLAEDYVLGVEIRQQDVVLLRNGTVIIVPLAEPQNRGQHFLLNVGWGPTTLHLNLTDAEGNRGHTATTTATFPPLSLKQWARRKALIPTIVYDSEKHFFEAVIDQVYILKQSLQDTNGVNGFWDIQYSGQRILKRSPKRETDVHPTIRLLFDNLEIIKNFQIIPEYPTGTGRLDFLITAPLRDGSIGKVCIEFKNAHSNDLAAGLMTQLPMYMNTTHTDYGVYAVLDYRPPYNFKPKTFKVDTFPGKLDNLETALNIGASQTGLKYLRPIIIAVGPTKSPSKKSG